MKPDFSGSWDFDAGESQLEIARPDAVVLTITHREPLFRLDRTLAFGGVSDTFAIDLTVGVEGAPVSQRDTVLHPSLRWEGDELVFLTTIERGGGEATNLVRYRLEEDGAVLVAEESFRGPGLGYDNRWVFRKRGELSR